MIIDRKIEATCLNSDSIDVTHIRAIDGILCAKNAVFLFKNDRVFVVPRNYNKALQKPEYLEKSENSFLRMPLT